MLCRLEHGRAFAQGQTWKTYERCRELRSLVVTWCCSVKPKNGSRIDRVTVEEALTKSVLDMLEEPEYDETCFATDAGCVETHILYML
jgi:hypothetical protein